MDDNKFITMLFKKHPIGKNEFIYTPIKSVICTDEEDGYYDVETNERYISLNDIQILHDEYSCSIDLYLFSYKEQKNSLDNIKGKKLTDNDIKRDFFKTFEQFYYHVIFKNNQLKITILNLLEDNISDDMLEIEDDILEIEDDIQIMNNIKENKYSKEELEIIKNRLIARESSIQAINQAIDNLENKKADKKKTLDEYEKRGIINIEKLYNEVTKTLIAQDEAAKEFITELAMLDLDNTNRKGILLTGDTGVGKTKLIELVAKYLNRPFLIVNSTQLTTAGYTGDDIEEYLYDLVEQCNFNIHEAEQAIVFFDEIDKKDSDKKSDVNGRGVLNQLLKFLDGTTYNACKDIKYKGETAIKFNTSNMIVIAGGAFTDVYNSKDSKKISGFNQNGYNRKEDITIDDFVNKAQMPEEFIGRFSIIHLKSLDAKDYERILKESDESPIISAQNKFNLMDNVQLSFTDDYLKKSAQIAKTKNSGVRGLNGIIIKSISQPFREINKNLGKYQEVIIDDKVLENSNNYQLVKRKSKNEVIQK